MLNQSPKNTIPPQRELRDPNEINFSNERPIQQLTKELEEKTTRILNGLFIEFIANSDCPPLPLALALIEALNIIIHEMEPGLFESKDALVDYLIAQFHFRRQDFEGMDNDEIQYPLDGHTT